MITETYVRFPQPVSLDLRLAMPPRRKIYAADGSFALAAEDPDHEPAMQMVEDLPLHLQIDAHARTITAYLPPIPRGLDLYGPEDFQAAVADTFEDHAARVMQILGETPEIILQALIDGEELPPSPLRVPREIPNWRAKAILTQMELLDQVESVISQLPEPQKTIVSLAWHGDAKFARKGATVTALAAAIGFSELQLDDLFIRAEALKI